jgi:O-antigen biosynthesis protein
VVRLIDWTGERAVPWVADVAMLYEHFHRYLWAARLVESRRVLDLGSGEGYGAAILARSAADVLGVDVDERAVEHAQANYACSGLRFEQASALDLAGLAEGCFDAVVAFEMIEHVADQERVMEEIQRVLAPAGLLVISTPDKDRYNAASGQVNSYHQRELSSAEFNELLRARFDHVAIWGQRTITGSYLSRLGVRAETESNAGAADFFVAASAEGLEVIDEPEPLFYVAVASNGPLPAVTPASTLADTGLELVLQTARAHAAAVAERDRLLGDANRTLEEKREEVLAVGAKLASVEEQLLAQGAKLASVEQELLEKGDELWALEQELADARAFITRLEESVTWQSFQRAKGLLYGLLGEHSRPAQAVRAMLRLFGRIVLRRPGPPSR